MAFRRPTLSNLRQIGRAIFAARLKGADATLPNSNITVSADIIAGMINGLYGFADYLARQALPNTADDWFFLLRWGALKGLTPVPAIAAAGNALFTGIVGTPIPNSTQFQYTFPDTTTLTFETTAAGTLGAGATSIPIVAMAGGANTNLPAGAPLTFVTAISGVNGTANVDSSGLSGGLDAESIQAFSKRVSDRFQNPPGIAGTKADYERTALGVAGVTRATASPIERGPGTVNIRFVMDGQANIVPSPSQVAAVQAVINTEKPLTDDALVLAPTALAVNYQLSAALVPPSALPAITQALAAMHGGLSVGSGLSLQGQIIPAITSVAKLTGTFLVSPNFDPPTSLSTVLVLGNVSLI